MLKVRESVLLWSLFESVVISLTARMDDVVQPVAFSKASLEFSLQDIEELKLLASELEEAKDEIDHLRSFLWNGSYTEIFITLSVWEVNYMKRRNEIKNRGPHAYYWDMMGENTPLFMRVFVVNRPFARWHHFTTTNRILQGFAILC